MKMIRVLMLDDARRVASAAEAEANRCACHVTIAICDSGGHIMWLQRMDGAPLVSAQIAPEKARTCVLTGKPSKATEDMVNEGRVAALGMPVLPMEGGEPIRCGADYIGAVGVSGAKPPQDAQIARAGATAL